MNRQTGQLRINAVHLEPGIALDGDTRAAVEKAIDNLASFLGAAAVEHTAPSW